MRDLRTASTLLSRRLLPLAILVVCLLAPSRAVAVPGDEQWSTRWCRPGPDQQVAATVEFNGQLVVGGLFSFVGSVPASRVAIFNGTEWSALGAGFNGNVEALVVFNNELYAGGGFTASGATPLRGLARWSGTAWVDVGGGVRGSVLTLAVYGAALAVGGNFDQVGAAISAGSIATWSGTTWSTLGGSGVHGGFVNDAAVFAGSLYVCGFFDLAGSAGAANIARWSGTAWSGLGSGLTDEFGDAAEAEVKQLHVYNSILAVVGSFAHAGGQARSNFATWNGTAWGTLGSNPTFFGNTLLSAGDYGGGLLVHANGGATYRWTGSFWTTFLTSATGAFTLGGYGSDLIVGGQFESANGVQAQSLARYNGTTWSALTAGDGASPGVLGFFEWNGKLTVGGSGTRFGPVANTMVAAWDGNAWSGFGTGIPGGLAHFVGSFADLQGELVAGGSFTTAGGTPADKFARWNGAAWSAMGGSNTGVNSMRVVRGALYAYGTVGFQTAVVRWNGSSWVSIGDVNDIVWKLDEYQGRLIAAGTFSTIGGASVRGLASWDSVSGTWSAIGASALNNSVFATTVDGDTLYIGGTFTTVGGNPVNRVAKWNGTSWSAVGTGVNSRVFDLLRFGDDLFATGEFTQAGGSPASFVARWNGSSWNAMGSGLNARGRGLGVYDDELYVGGDFTQAGGTYASGISSWSSPVQVGVEPRPASPGRLALTAAPSPFEQSTVFAWRLASPSHVQLRVFDLAGRVVATLLEGSRNAGDHSARWDGRDTQGGTLPAGIYLCRIDAGGVSGTRRVVRTR